VSRLFRQKLLLSRAQIVFILSCNKAKFRELTRKRL
jgi:hypothetical protein